MKGNRALVLLVFIFLLNFGSLYTSIGSNNSNRSFDKKKIEEYSENSDFQYTRNPDQASGFWGYVWFKIVEIFTRIFSFRGGEQVKSVLIYTIIIGIVGYALIVVFKVDFNGVFGRKSNVLNTIHAVSSQDSSGDYQSLIEQACHKGDYKTAIRYNYLDTLNLLSKKGAINWKPWKTPNDYVYQLKENLRSDFQLLSNIFSFVWYGDFTADPNDFEESESLKKSIQKKLKKGD